MARYQILIYSRPLAGQDDTFNDWYDRVHVGDVLGVPGFLTCQRYVLREKDQPPRYAAAYEIESDNPQATLGTLFEAMKSLEISPTLDRTSVSIQVLEPAGPLRTA